MYSRVGRIVIHRSLFSMTRLGARKTGMRVVLGESAKEIKNGLIDFVIDL